MMSDAMTHGFRNLTRFSGRDPRRLFWPHAAIIFVFTFLAMAVAMSVVMGQVFSDMQTFATAHPEGAKIESSPGYYSIQIDPNHPAAPEPDFTLFSATVAIAAAFAILLLAAAVSRRLHDSGRSAYWGLVPAALLSANLSAFPFMMNDFMVSESPNMMLFSLLFISGLLYNVTLIVLVVVCALPGTPGANRYGEP